MVKALGFHRSVIYEWLGRFRKGGMAALGAKAVPGRPSKLTPEQLRRLVTTIEGKNPLQLRFKYGLWTPAARTAAYVTPLPVEDAAAGVFFKAHGVFGGWGSA